MGLKERNATFIYLLVLLALAMCLPGGAFLGVPPAPMLNMPPAAPGGAGEAAVAPGYPGGAAGIPPNEGAPKDGGCCGCCCCPTPAPPKAKLAGVLLVFCIELAA